MTTQLLFIFSKVIQFIQSGNLAGAELLLNQIIKNAPKNSEALRYLAFIYTKRGDLNRALELIDKSIEADRRNEAAHNNKGSIQQDLGMFSEAINSYQNAIKCNPRYAEAFNNLGNAYQELGESMAAVDYYNKAISIDQANPEFLCNLGNALWKLDRLEDARLSYEKAISLAPGHANSSHNLAHLDLREFNFANGWGRYESRWFTGNGDHPPPIATSKPRWDGLPRSGRLFIWAEQGIGDQILYASMLKELEQYPQTIIVSTDKKLLPIFSHSFPHIQFVDKDQEFSEKFYDEHIPMGSLGAILRPTIESFKASSYPYLIPNRSRSDLGLQSGINCGLSWKSLRAKFGVEKSVALGELRNLLGIKGVNFVNLQYGDVRDEIVAINSEMESFIQVVEDIDLFNDIDGVLDILNACSVVVTTSNTTAHLAGALGKETLLMLPCGNSRFWYWHDIDGVSLWYPSVRVFKQQKRGDWSGSIEAIKSYLEKKFAD